MKFLLFVAAVVIAAYWFDANWCYGQYSLAVSRMLRDIYLHVAAVV